MEQSPSWEAKVSSATQEIPHILWNPKIYYRVYKNFAICPFPLPDRFSPCPHPISRRSILILSSHLRLGLSSGLQPSGFPTKTPYAPLLSPIRATCSANLSLLDHPNDIWWEIQLIFENPQPKFLPQCERPSFTTMQNNRKDFTRWFKYDRDYLCVNKSQFVPVIFEPPCISTYLNLYTCG